MWFLSSLRVHNSFDALRPINCAVVPSTSAKSSPAHGPLGIGSVGRSPSENRFAVGRKTPSLEISAL